METQRERGAAIANALGYEELLVGTIPVGPTASLVEGGVACAVFYVDPNAAGAVNWRSGPQTSDYPTQNKGFPLNPGKWLSVAGEAVIRTSRLVRAGTSSKVVKVHVLYFDRVDVIAADFAGGGSLSAVETALLNLLATNGKMLEELKKHTAAWEGGLEKAL